MALFVFLIFLFGLIWGSFLNAFLYRYQTQKSLFERSICPNCQHKISWYDNLPIVSWMLLKGRCRHCHQQISIQYPIVEFLMGTLSLAAGMISGFSISLNQTFFLLETFDYFSAIKFLVLFVIFFILLAIAVYDIKTKEIPNGFNFTFVVFALIYSVLININNPGFLTDFFYLVLTGLTAFAFFYALVIFSNETWMGGGDAKLALGMGLLLGPINTFIAVFMASIIGSIIGVGLIIQGSLKHKKVNHEIPFGPFLALGTVIALSFGSQIASWYVKIFIGV